MGLMDVKTDFKAGDIIEILIKGVEKSAIIKEVTCQELLNDGVIIQSVYYTIYDCVDGEFITLSESKFIKNIIKKYYNAF
jgi:hypothetical protein